MIFYHEEFWNGISMIVPFFLSMYYHVVYKKTFLFVIAKVLHHPFSILYHLNNIYLMYSPQILKKLDVAFIHVGCIIYTIILSNCAFYIILSICFNLYWMYNVWQDKIINNYINSQRIFYGFLMYTFPILWNGDYYNYILAILFAFLSGYTFLNNIFGFWNHSIFHLLLNGVIYHVLNAAK
jgi:hypothetical protein